MFGFHFLCVGAVMVVTLSPVNSELSPAATTASLSVVARSYSCRGGDKPIYRLIEDDDCRAFCLIEVENWTRYPLVKPSVRLISAGGNLVYIPREVLPGCKDTTMPCEDSTWTARDGYRVVDGTYGTISWELLGLKRRLYIMWSMHPLPGHENKATPKLSNWLAIGLSAEGHVIDPPGNVTYLTMAYLNSTDQLGFERYRFETNENIQPFTYENGGIQVEGMMGVGRETEATVRVRPINEENLAPVILSEMQNPGSSSSLNNARSQASVLASSAVVTSVPGNAFFVGIVMFAYMVIV